MTFTFRALSALLLLYPIASIGQNTPSVPTQEGSYTAGETFCVDINLKVKTEHQLHAELIYSLLSDGNSSNALTGPKSFRCYTDVDREKQTFRIECHPPINTIPGLYKADGALVLSRSETGANQTYPELRHPLVRINFNPLGETHFPQAAGSVLVFTGDQALRDGAENARGILNRIALQYPLGMRNTKENRAFLISEVGQARNIVEETKRRYSVTNNPSLPMPVLFDDFARRYSKVLKEIGGKQTAAISRPTPELAHIVLVQLPKTQESVEAQAGGP